MRRASNGGGSTNDGIRAGSLGAGSRPSVSSITSPAGVSVPGLDLSGVFLGGGSSPSPAGDGSFSFGG